MCRSSPPKKQLTKDLWVFFKSCQYKQEHTHIAHLNTYLLLKLGSASAWKDKIPHCESNVKKKKKKTPTSISFT